MSDSTPRDRAVPNLPSRDLDTSEAFYAGFGFERAFRDDGWMILRRGGLQLEFFPFAELDPAASAHRCTVRVADVDELAEAIAAAGVPVRDTGFPRLHEVRLQDWGLRAGHLVDPDGNLLTLIAEPALPEQRTTSTAM
ncbi:bleomycin resistance protein [Agromyces sp. ZXT2-6]|uniref:bleomycin resistance protein n=1 Tax=Agromyces sp. ZXT2-6 TaxID=3461153 RepID=UPI004054EA86